MAFMKSDMCLYQFLMKVECNYWKMRLFKFLELKGCKVVVVEREIDVADNEIECKKQDIKVTIYIQSYSIVPF